jgi:hypothetical protein
MEERSRLFRSLLLLLLGFSLGSLVLPEWNLLVLRAQRERFKGNEGDREVRKSRKTVREDEVALLTLPSPLLVRSTLLRFSNSSSRSITHLPTRLERDSTTRRNCEASRR